MHHPRDVFIVTMSSVGGWCEVAGVNRTDRLYALVEELRAVAPRPRSARQLAGKYEVSRRTVAFARLLARLRAKGVCADAVRSASRPGLPAQQQLRGSRGGPGEASDVEVEE